MIFGEEWDCFLPFSKKKICLRLNEEFLTIAFIEEIPRQFSIDFVMWLSVFILL